MKKTAYVALGVFDGVHVGHQAVIKRLIKSARRDHAAAVAVTFDPHPMKMVSPKKAPPMLFSVQHRVRLLTSSGFNRVEIIKFDKKLASLSAETFIKRYLIDRLNMKALFVGQDVNIGSGRHGNARGLLKLAKKFGFNAVIIKPKIIFQEVVSSTLIRRNVLTGNLAKASKLLGRPFSILGTVVRGDRRGRRIGFPTANLDIHHETLPPSGVYAVKVLCSGRQYQGVLNIGRRPTFKGPDAQESVEVYIFKFDRNIYGKDIELVLIGKIRDEIKFPDAETLAAQIVKDIARAKSMLTNKQTGIRRL